LLPTSSSAARIRLATKGDLDAICRLEDDSFSDPYPRTLLSRLLREHAKNFFVAEIPSGKVVGYCVCVRDGKVAHLISIGVLSEYRKRGVGAVLIEHLLAQLGSTARELWLEVNTHNDEAVRLYERFGFEKVMVIENYYSDGSSALRMQLPLDQRGRQSAVSRRSR